MGRPKFSVIIPTYNREHFIKVCLESVFNQTFKDYEIIVVDDGSNDNTSYVIKKFKKDNLIYLYQDNKGPGCARNKGIFNSSGDYIAFLDSDDKWTQDKLEVVNKYIDSNPSYKVFHTQEKWFKNGKIHNPKKKHKKPHGYIFENALKICSVSISTAVVRKDVFKDIGFFNEDFPVCEDYDLWIRISLKYPLFLIDEVLTLKDGGRKDQLSYIYMAKDKYRIKSLVNLASNKDLKKEQSEKLIKELERKCKIFTKGCLKRGKKTKANYYISLTEKIKKNL